MNNIKNLDNLTAEETTQLLVAKAHENGYQILYIDPNNTGRAVEIVPIDPENSYGLKKSFMDEEWKIQTVSIGNVTSAEFENLLAAGKKAHAMVALLNQIDPATLAPYPQI